MRSAAIPPTIIVATSPCTFHDRVSPQKSIIAAYDRPLVVAAVIEEASHSVGDEVFDRLLPPPVPQVSETARPQTADMNWKNKVGTRSFLPQKMADFCGAA
jgi:hypothetical protein